MQRTCQKTLYGENNNDAVSRAFRLNQFIVQFNVVSESLFLVIIIHCPFSTSIRIDLLPITENTLYGVEQS